MDRLKPEALVIHSPISQSIVSDDQPNKTSSEAEGSQLHGTYQHANGSFRATENRSFSNCVHIKKPLNAFMLFMKEKRSQVMTECTLKESAAINQILGRKWHALSREEQAKYYNLARMEREAHQRLYPGWSARDNYANQIKRRKRRGNNELSKQLDRSFGVPQNWSSYASRLMAASTTVNNAFQNHRINTIQGQCSIEPSTFASDSLVDCKHHYSINNLCSVNHSNYEREVGGVQQDKTTSKPTESKALMDQSINLPEDAQMHAHLLASGLDGLEPNERHPLRTQAHQEYAVAHVGIGREPSFSELSSTEEGNEQSIHCRRLVLTHEQLPQDFQTSSITIEGIQSRACIHVNDGIPDFTRIGSTLDMRNNYCMCCLPHSHPYQANYFVEQSRNADDQSRHSWSPVHAQLLRAPVPDLLQSTCPQNFYPGPSYNVGHSNAISEELFKPVLSENSVESETIRAAPSINSRSVFSPTNNVSWITAELTSSQSVPTYDHQPSSCSLAFCQIFHEECPNESSEKYARTECDQAKTITSGRSSTISHSFEHV